MKKAVMYGAGNIGRGFIGQKLSESGYMVTFIDINDAVVNALIDKKAYPVKILLGDGKPQEIEVKNVTAVNGKDINAAARAIAEADIIATAVGVNVLKHIAEPLAAGILKRFERSDAEPVNIIICENLIGADKYLRGLIADKLPEDKRGLLEKVGFAEASIGRMVPVQTPEMQDGNLLRICTEAYSELPVDSSAFIGEIPKINGLVPYAPFDFYICRKLLVHNMGHAMTAYLGALQECEYIAEAIEKPEIKEKVSRAMHASAKALSVKFGVELAELYEYVDDLLVRFANPELMDTVKRVGNDIKRKLGENDRIIGAIRLCEETGIDASDICIAAAAAMKFKYDETSAFGCEKILSEISKLDRSSKYYSVIKKYYAEM